MMEFALEKVVRYFEEIIWTRGGFLYIPRDTQKLIVEGTLRSGGIGTATEIIPGFVDKELVNSPLWAQFKRIEAGELYSLQQLCFIYDLPDPQAWHMLAATFNLCHEPVLTNFPDGVARLCSFKIFIGWYLPDHKFQEAPDHEAWMVLASISGPEEIKRLRRLLVENVWRGMTPLQVIEQAKKRGVVARFGKRSWLRKSHT